MNKKSILLALIITFSLSACSILPEKTDPFSQVEEEKIETLYGEIFPFSVSVSTEATHRLEKDNKLVSLIASKIVRLEEFEGRIVEVDGVYRKEKMRPIFWVDAIRVRDLGTNSAKLTNRFESTNYSFVIPESWESSILEDGTVHFLDKKDPNRKIFLTFAVQDISEFDKKGDPNIVMANMAGNKTSSTFDSGQIRQEINLFSNLFDDKKYVFIFNNGSDDFSQKKDFFKLLNSFIEGEENVKAAHEEELRELAEEELKLIKASKIDDLEKEKSTEDAEEQASDNIISRIFGSEDDENKSQEQTIEAIANEEPLPEKIEKMELSLEFENKIDNRAFDYTSEYYKFSMKVPYGLWFKNFGPNDDYLTQVGFATYELGGRSTSEIFLNIVAADSPVLEFQELQANGQLIIQFPRNKNSYYELRGSLSHRDYMRSIQSSVLNF